MNFLDKTGLAHLWTHIMTKLNTKVDKVDGKSLSTNDYTDAEKEKLAGIAEGANKTIVDSALNSTSTNPVQNKAINSELTKKANQSTFDGSYSLGSFNNKTLAELQTALDTWLEANNDTMGASAQFNASGDWINFWNSKDLTTTMSGGGTWSVTVTSRDSDLRYVQLRFSRYQDKMIYYVCKYNNIWKSIYKVAFKDDLEEFQSKLDKKADIENGILNGAVLSTATSMVGHEYNILLHSYTTGRYTFTESGTGLLGENGLLKLTNGKVQPAYSSDGIDPDNPYVLLIEGLPTDHTQRGGFFGWTCRYWAPMRFTVEGYDDVYHDGWTMLADYSENTNSSVGANFIIPFFNSNPELSLAGAYTKLRITVYESIPGNHVGANGFRKWGISELFFCHPEAGGTVYQYADVDMVDGKHASDFYQKGVDTTFNGNITGKASKVNLEVGNWDTYRPVWIDDTTKTGTPNYNDNFTYNPAQGDLKVNKINGKKTNELATYITQTNDPGENTNLTSGTLLLIYEE